jgi:hypothetical protein
MPFGPKTATCAILQETIVDPICANKCCPQCQQEFEDVAGCIINKMLEYNMENCDLECGGGERRKLGRTSAFWDNGAVPPPSSGQTAPPEPKALVPGCLDLETIDKILQCFATALENLEGKIQQIPTLPPEFQQYVPGCKDLESPEEMIACLEEYLQDPPTAPPDLQEIVHEKLPEACKDMETQEEIIACVNATLAYLKDLKEVYENLPPCVKTTVEALGYCALENHVCNVQHGRVPQKS